MMRTGSRTILAFFLLAATLALTGPNTAVGQVDLELSDEWFRDFEVRPMDGGSLVLADKAILNVQIQNTSDSAATNAKVNVDLPSGLVLDRAPGDGSYSSGTWTIDLDPKGGTNDSGSLNLVVALTESIPQTITARLDTVDQSDPDGASTSGRVIPLIRGSGGTLAFDGSGGVDLGSDTTINSGGPYPTRTIEAWFKTDDPSRTQILFEEGGGNAGFNLYLRNGKVYAGAWGGGVNNTWFDTSVESGRWYHVALVFDAPNDSIRAYLDGEQFGSAPAGGEMPGHGNDVGIANLSQSTRLESDDSFSPTDSSTPLDGRIDQVRLWDAALPQREVQARAHRTIDLNMSGADSLIAAYRFEAGSGSVAYDLAGPPYQDGTVAGSPQWTGPSGASVGRNSKVLTDANTPVTVGPSGSEIETSLQSGTGLSGSTTVYRSGRASGSPVTSDALPLGVPDRSNVTWGLWSHGSAEAEASISYGNVNGLVTDGSEPVGLLRRPAPDTAWVPVSSNANVSHDTANDQFTVSGVTGRYQYAVANIASKVDLTLAAEPSVPELRPDGADQETVTVELAHADGVVDATDVAVDVSVPSGLTVSAAPSTGTYSGGTWDVGTLTPGAQATLDLTVGLSDVTPQDLTVRLDTLGQMDPDSASTQARVVPAPYGSGQALALDGTDDYVQLPDESRFDLTGNFSVSFWMKVDSSGFDDEFEALVTKGDFTWRVQRNDTGNSLAFDTDHGGVTVTTDASTPVNDGEWHHVAAVYDQSAGEKRLYVDGRLDGTSSISTDVATDDQPVRIGSNAQKGGREFGGQIDQVRIWGKPLSPQDVRTQAYRTLDLGAPAADSLLAAYRFDTGRDTTAYDVGPADSVFSDGSFQGNPQWVAPSGAPIGQASAVADSGGSVTVGPTGGSVSATITSDTLTVYQYGRTGGPLVDGTLPGEDFSGVGADRRLPLVWGLAPIDSATADVTFDFSRAQGINDSTSVRLLKRDGPDSTWTDVTSQWTLDASAETFSRDSVTAFSQYAVAGDAQSLPVELAGFAGTGVEEGVRLTWQTASEEGNAGFRIQRTREENAGWTTVGFVDGAGTTSAAQRYRFTDAEVPFAAEAVRYRLAQVDVGGAVRYSDVITVERGGVQELTLKAPYPNPAGGRATVPFAVPEGTDAEAVRMRLYDVLGRRVRTVRATAEPGRHEVRLETGDLASGVYFLRLRAGETIRTRKVTIVR